MTDTITVSPLHRADGSASYSCNGYSVIAAVNGPVEVQRKDEIPEEATIDVVLRPAVGVGAVRERHLESIVEKALRQVIIVSAHPRTLIQITLQIVATPAENSGSGALHQSHPNLSLLPALLQSSMLALLVASIPLAMVLTSTLIAVSARGELLRDPQPHAIKEATSMHLFGFSSLGDLAVAESEGTFSIDTWEQASNYAEQLCRGSASTDIDQTGDVNMASSHHDSLENAIKSVMEQKNAKKDRWKEV
ncbi:MAG: hypothetical protein Q9216_001581 [Gyalolechia sp. 2 TL-2023]